MRKVHLKGARKFGVMVGTLVLILALIPGSALAVTISFAGLQGGTITGNPAGTFVGSGININEIEISGAFQNNGVFGVQNGSLDFNAVNGVGPLSISGSIPGLGINTSTTLLSGTTANIEEVGLPMPQPIFSFVGEDSKSEALLNAIGVVPTPGFTFAGSTVTVIRSTNPVVLDVNSSSFENVGGSAIPEPNSLLLLGTGMIGLGAWQWRRNKKNQNAA